MGTFIGGAVVALSLLIILAIGAAFFYYLWLIYAGLSAHCLTKDEVLWALIPYKLWIDKFREWWGRLG